MKDSTKDNAEEKYVLRFRQLFVDLLEDRPCVCPGDMYEAYPAQG